MNSMYMKGMKGNAPAPGSAQIDRVDLWIIIITPKISKNKTKVNKSVHEEWWWAEWHSQPATWWQESWPERLELWSELGLQHSPFPYNIKFHV